MQRIASVRLGKGVRQVLGAEFQCACSIPLSWPTIGWLRILGHCKHSRACQGPPEIAHICWGTWAFFMNKTEEKIEWSAALKKQRTHVIGVPLTECSGPWFLHRWRQWRRRSWKIFAVTFSIFSFSFLHLPLTNRLNLLHFTCWVWPLLHFWRSSEFLNWIFILFQ